MPLKRAWIFLLLLIPLTVFAFWRNYFSNLDGAPLAYHVHGVVATLWILLLALQSWSIHHGQAGLHRTAGKLSFLIFPLFMVGGVMVLHMQSITTADGSNPFNVLFGTRLGWLDVFAGAGFALFYFLALYHRANVQLHSRYMIATALFLLSPIFGRIIPGVVPGLLIRGPEDIGLFVDALHYSNLIAGLIAAALFAAAPRYGMPFLIVIAITGLQSAAFQFLGRQEWWVHLHGLIGTIPLPALQGVALLAGVAIIWLGWTLPKKRDGLAAAE